MTVMTLSHVLATRKQHRLRSGSHLGLLQEFPSRTLVCRPLVGVRWGAQDLIQELPEPPSTELRDLLLRKDIVVESVGLAAPFGQLRASAVHRR